MTSTTDSLLQPGAAPDDPGEKRVLGYLFDQVENDQFEVNQRAAARAAGLADAIDYARVHHSIYAIAGDARPEVTAERCAVLEASVRLSLSTSAIRSLAYTAEAAREQLPQLWRRATEGFASLNAVETALSHLSRFDGRAEALAEFDSILSESVIGASPASFRGRVARLAARLVPRPEIEDHAEAALTRRVSVEAADAGMSWLSVFLPTVEASAIKARLNSTAKHAQRHQGDQRTRDQIRADLASAWLRGEGTPTAVKTKVFVAVRLDELDERARASVRTDAALHPGLDLNQGPLLLGHGPIDADTARKLLLEAGEFTRIITDPVTGVILDMDRRSRKVTRAQREWLMLLHSSCARDGCSRPAVDAEIDHFCEFHGPGRGLTNIDNLGPLCEPEHKLRGTTGIRFDRRPDGSIGLQFPTGYRTEKPSEWSVRIKALVDRLRAPRPLPDQPPF